MHMDVQIIDWKGIYCSYKFLKIIAQVNSNGRLSVQNVWVLVQA